MFFIDPNRKNLNHILSLFLIMKDKFLNKSRLYFEYYTKYSHTFLLIMHNGVVD